MTLHARPIVGPVLLTMALALAGTAPAEASAGSFHLLGSGRLSAAVTATQCSVTSPDGTTTSVPCQASGWSPTLEPGWTALMNATVSYRYVDDGLPLGFPASLQVNSRDSVTSSFESAVLYAATSFSNCVAMRGAAEHCGSRVPYDTYFGAYDFPPLFLSTNDRADDVSGQVEVVTGWRWEPPSDFYGRGSTLTPNLYVQPWGIANAVPEPGTWALMLGPLIGLAGWSRRRRSALRQ